MKGKTTRMPFLNVSTKNLPAEKWRDIPDFEGYYQISNYGRVKSMRREILMNSPNGGVYVSKERIRRAALDTKQNKTVNKPLYNLSITLNRDGIKYYFSVARLVYLVFVGNFDLEDGTIFITQKDGDGRNVHASNLVRTRMSPLKLHSYEAGRAISHLRALSKPVTQFGPDGKIIGVYDSMYEAGKKNGIGERSIAGVASGKTHMYKGFFWKTGRHSRQLNLDKIERFAARPLLHTSLMKRLRIRKVDMNSPPPLLNLSTKSMKGERWKDMPGYEGLYEVSNLGRVKALQKITQGNKRQWLPEQIQRTTVDFRKDQRGKEIAGSAFAGVAKDGRKKLISIPRFVYHLFVKKFDLGNSRLRVYYKDGNTLNLHYKNLFLESAEFSIIKK